MSYSTGTVSSLNDLRTAIFNACTANGWTLSGDVLHKGSAYFRLQVVGASLQLCGGTGKDGVNNLTGPATKFVQVSNTGVPTGIVYPATYHIHIGATPDEVYVVINHSTDYYQWLAFGQSHIPLAAGTGNWFGATHPEAFNPSTGAISIYVTGSGGIAYSSGALFWSSQLGVVTITNSLIHHGLSGGTGWSGTGNPNTDGGRALAIEAVAPLLTISPNAFNGESLLLPIPVMVGRPSSLYSLVAQPKFSRYIRLDNHAPGEVITIGGEQWKIYPWMKKDAINRNGSHDGGGITHSGTLGWAIRYTP